MKQVFLYSMALCLLIGCSKHHDQPDGPGNDPQPPPPGLVRLKSLNTNIFRYDSLGRLIQANYGNSITGRTDYTYFKDSVIGRDFDRQGNLYGGGSIFYFAGNGLATRQKYIVDSTLTPLILTFTHDADRHVIEQVIGDEGKAPTTRTVYYYSKGNMDSAKVFYIANNSLLQLERFEYYTDQPNLLSNEHKGVGYVGADNVNLPKKEVQINAGATTVIEYTYEFDTDKRPVKQHMFVDGALWSDLEYTWVVL